MSLEAQYIASGVCIAAGVLMAAFYKGPHHPLPSATELLYPGVLLSVGVGLLAWRVLVMLLALVSCLALVVWGHQLGERRYARRFPVFKTPPLGSITRKDGFRYDLHIARIPAGYIIGLSYQTEVDLAPRTCQTRWRDVFPDYPSARRALLKRLIEKIPADQMPRLA